MKLLYSYFHIFMFSFISLTKFYSFLLQGLTYLSLHLFLGPWFFNMIVNGIILQFLSLFVASIRQYFVYSNFTQSM